MNYHLMVDDKFIDDFIADAELTTPEGNVYIVWSEQKSTKYVHSKHAQFEPNIHVYLTHLLKSISKEDKVFIHWLHEALYDFILAVDPDVKIGLFFWGGDIVQEPEEIYSTFNYDPLTLNYFNKHRAKKPAYFRIYKNPINILRNRQRKKLHKSILADKLAVRQRIMSRLDYFMHWNKFDYEWIKNHFPAFNAEYLYHYYGVGLDTIILSPTENENDTITFWLGNSATMTNNHLDMLWKLSRYKKENIKVYCPLSYGESIHSDYVSSVLRTGKEIFGNKFYPLVDFITRDEYYKILNNVDIAVMGHNRTQAAGNIFAFITMGKVISMQSVSTIYQLLKEHSIQVYTNTELFKLTFNQLLLLKENKVNQNDKIILHRHILNETAKHETLHKLLING